MDAYGLPALHGMLTASVVGPSPVPLEWILQAVLSPPESKAIEVELYPEFSWVAKKAEELLSRIEQVFAEDPELFRLLVYMPKLKEGDTTPDPQTWCNGFVEGMAYHREDWKPMLTREVGFLALAPIMMTSDPDEWEEKGVLNPFTELTPLELGDALKLGTLAVHKFWSDFEEVRVRSERQRRQDEMTRALAAAARNTNVAVDAKLSQAVRRRK
jgi:yecA family protein